MRHIISISGAGVQTTMGSTTGFKSFPKPLVLPAGTGFDALNNTSRTVYVYGRLVDADSALLSGTDKNG
jgi:hypothetical protein